MRNEEEFSPISFGTVDDEDPVTFDEARGPLVRVILQPLRVPVICRVAMRVAGRGEGDFFPFVPGDEVLVACPEGPRGECAIFARLPNETDAFPTSVAGQNATANALSFERRRTAHLVECEGTWGAFSQPTGAFVSVAKEGNVTLRDGAQNSLQLSADVLAYLSADAKHLLQLNVTDERFHVQTGEALLVLSADGSAVLAPSTLTLATAGNPAHEHVATTEAVFAILDAWQKVFLAAWALAWAGVLTPAEGVPLGPLLTGPLASVFEATNLAIAAGTAGTLPDALAAAIYARFGTSTIKPAGEPGTGQRFPGIGCPGLLAG